MPKSAIYEPDKRFASCYSMCIMNTFCISNTMNIYVQLYKSCTLFLFVQVANFTVWEESGDRKKNRDCGQTCNLCANTEFQSTWVTDPGHDSLSYIALNMAMGRLQCCDHLGPVPWGLNCAVVRSAGSWHLHEPTNLRQMVITSISPYAVCEYCTSS